VMANSEDSFITAVGESHDDPKRPDKYVYVEVDVPGLKKHVWSKSASNADIEFDPQESSFTVTVKFHGSEPRKTYRYAIKRLPGPILPDPKLSYFKVRKDGQVNVYLAKAEPGRWDEILKSVGLEQDV